MTLNSFDVHRFSYRVNYSLCTLGNHVYYARYLDLLEIARGEFFRAIGFPLSSLQERGFIFPVTECSIKYRAAARYDDEVCVESWVEQLTQVRLSFGFRMLRSDVVLVEGRTDHVCCNLDEKPVRMLGEIAAALRPYLRTP
jgi:acyl-CoA thioester hydrolase